jgi:uncharacterized membrane protein YoaK (UPF0700 family)
MVDNATNFAEKMLYGTLLILTFVSGFIDAASYIALGHVFTANMTGKVIFIAFALAGVPGLSLFRSALALLAGLVGGSSRAILMEGCDEKENFVALRSLCH